MLDLDFFEAPQDAMVSGLAWQDCSFLPGRADAVKERSDALWKPVSWQMLATSFVSPDRICGLFGAYWLRKHQVYQQGIKGGHGGSLVYSLVYRPEKACPF